MAKGILFEVLGKDVLKFDTAKSFAYFIACKDNHKAWQAFEIYLHGTTMALVRLYTSPLPCGVIPTALGRLLYKSVNIKMKKYKHELNDIKLMYLLCLRYWFIIRFFAMNSFVTKLCNQKNHECCNNCIKISGFLQWQATINSPTLKMIVQLTLSNALGKTKCFVLNAMENGQHIHFLTCYNQPL